MCVLSSSMPRILEMVPNGSKAANSMLNLSSSLTGT